MKKYITCLLTICTLTGALNAVTAPTAGELTQVLKEVIETPFSTVDTKVTFDMIDYHVKENHIANIAVSIEIENSAMQLRGEVHRRHPKLGSLSGCFQGMGQDAIFVADFNFAMNFSNLSGFEQLIVETDYVPELSLAAPMMPKDFYEMKELIKSNDRISNLRIVQQNSKGMVEKFSFSVKDLEAVDKSMLCATEFIVSLNGDYFNIKVIVKDPTLSHCVFGEDEQVMMRTFESLRNREPSTIACAKSVVEFVKSYCNMLTTMPPAMFQNSGIMDGFDLKQ